MTSLSLKNRRTTLWSMLQRTSRSISRAWLSDAPPAIIALLSTCAIIAGGHSAVAENYAAVDNSAGKETLTAPIRRLPNAALSGSASKAGQSALLDAAPAAVTGPVRKNSRPSAGMTRSTTVRAVSRAQKMERGNIIDTAASGKKIARVSAESFVDEPGEVLPPVSETLPAPPETWGQEYATHVDDVLTGGACRCDQESVGTWWNRRLPTVEMVTIEPGQLKSSAREFIANHTLPPEHDYDVDVYDQKPIAVTSAQINVPQNAANDAKDSAEPGKNRLKTDIRKIRPTLSYAMRNIEESQLPSGFHEKLDQGQYVARQASPAVLQWAPTNLYYHPLYFEDPSLERYGHTYHPVVQPFASAGRFATQLVGLPYQMALRPVHSREYALGFYRPGECAPKKHYQIPFNEEAALVQAAAMVGFFFIFP